MWAAAWLERRFCVSLCVVQVMLTVINTFLLLFVSFVVASERENRMLMFMLMQGQLWAAPSDGFRCLSAHPFSPHAPSFTHDG